MLWMKHHGASWCVKLALEFIFELQVCSSWLQYIIQKSQSMECLRVSFTLADGHYHDVGFQRSWWELEMLTRFAGTYDYGPCIDMVSMLIWSMGGWSYVVRILVSTNEHLCYTLGYECRCAFLLHRIPHEGTSWLFREFVDHIFSKSEGPIFRACVRLFCRSW
jgi:hypothetical protein